MTIAATLKKTNRASSWTACRLRRWRKVHSRLPSQATTVATDAEMIRAVRGLSLSGPVGVPFAEHPQQVWAEDQEVVAPEVDHERDSADHAELEHLAHEHVEGPAGTVEQAWTISGHGGSLASDAEPGAVAPR